MKDGHDDNRSSITSGIHKSERLHPDKKKNIKYLSETMKGGHDGNRSSIASGIHKSEILHPYKKNRTTCKLRRRYDKNNSKESSIT
jgi:hypothetical protein